MKTKLISFILCFFVISSLSLVPVSAAGTSSEDYTADIEFINALGLGEVDIKDTDKPITRKEAVLLSMGLYLGRYITFSYNGEFSDISADDENAGKLALAVKNGIASATADGRFVPDGKVSYIDGIKMVFNSLNYGQFVKSTGQGDVRYHMLANEYDVNVSPKAVSALTVGEMAHLVAMAAEAPYMVIKSTDSNGDVWYDRTQNVTALSYQHGIETVEAQVVQNGFTSLITADALEKGKIKLGSVVLKCGDGIDTRELLGRKIKAYYLEETMDMLYYIIDDEQKTLIINDNDIKSFDANTDTYYYYDGNRTKSCRINQNSAYIYNGVALTSADAASILAGDIFKPETGKVEIIDNGNGYDCVKITDYKTYVVSGVDSVGQKIIDKYGLTPLDYYNNENLSVRDSYGNSIGFEYIDKENILLVEESLSGSSANIIVCADAVEGALNSIGNGKILIEGESFEISDILEKRIAGYNMANPGMSLGADIGLGVPAPKTGEYVVLLLDALGRVADYKLSADGGWKYGYAIQKTSPQAAQAMNSELMVEILTTDDSVERFNVAKNVTIDGVKYTRYTDSQPAIITSTLIRYRLNPKGEIKDIDNPGTSANPELPGTNEDAVSLKEHYIFNRSEASIPNADSEYRDFTYVSSVNGVTFRYTKDSYRTTTKYFKKGAYCFTVPVNSSDTNPKNFSASPIEGTQLGGAVKVYWTDENEIVNTAMVRYSSVSQSVNQNVYIVDKVTQAVDDEGEKVWKFYLMNSGTIKEYTAPEQGVYDSTNPLTCGDIIRISASEKREIKLIERTFDWENAYNWDNTSKPFFEIGKNYPTFPASVEDKNPHSFEGLGVNDELYLLYGKAMKLNNNVMEISYTDVSWSGDSTSRVRSVTENKTEQLYLNGRVIVVENTAGGYKLRIGTAADIVFDPSGTYSSRVVIDARYVVIRNIIVYK